MYFLPPLYAFTAPSPSLSLFSSFHYLLNYIFSVPVHNCNFPFGELRISAQYSPAPYALAGVIPGGFVWASIPSPAEWKEECLTNGIITVKYTEKALNTIEGRFPWYLGK